MPINADTPIHDYFESLGEPLRAKLLRQEPKFRDMGYLTAGSFEAVFGVLQPPDFNKSRSMVTTAKTTFTRTSDIGYRKRQASKTFRLSVDEIDELMRATTRVTRRTKTLGRSKAEGFYGSLGKDTLAGNRPFRIVNVEDLKYRLPKESEGRWILPDIQNRLGQAWNQESRSTCVAFSVAGLSQYLHPYGNRPSPQFLYHQCKLIDGRPNLAGTTLTAAMQAVADGTLSGRGRDWGTADCGIPDEETWPYKGTDVRGNEAQTPPPANLRDKIYRTPRWGSLGGEVIRLSGSRKIINDLRTLLKSANIPVSVGMDVFPSIENHNTRRTGLITLPMEGEKPTAGHAMLVCGYDDAEKTFLVRNSWGSDWAAQNPWNMPGYALMPYRYFEKFSHGAYSLRHLSITADIDISEESRLYNGKRNIVSRKTTYTVADLTGKRSSNGKTKKTGARRTRTKGFWRRLIS